MDEDEEMGELEREGREGNEIGTLATRGGVTRGRNRTN